MAPKKERQASAPRGAGKRSDTPKPRAAPKGKGPKVQHWIDFASKEHKDIVHAEINMFGRKDGPWDAVVVRTDSNVYTYTKGDFSSVHALPRVAKDRFKDLMGNPGLNHFGLFLGLLKTDQFNVSLECASLMCACGVVTKNWVRLTPDGEKSFLYGQDVKKAHVAVVATGGITHDRGICIVVNEAEECLGVGQLATEDPAFKSNEDEDIVLKNVVDKGIYLRAQHAV